MHETIEQVIDAVRGSWRFRRYALVAAWIAALLGWAMVFSLPDVYQAGSRVFVDTKTALKPVLENLVLDQDVNAQLNLVRQALLATPQLEPVAQEVGLVDTRTMTPPQRARVLRDMQDRIKLTVTQAGQQERQDRDAGSIYSIQYEDVSRDRAIKVVQILQNNLIEQTLGGKRSGSESAQKFLEGQITDYEQRLRVAEDRLATFKKQNVGLMPTEQGGYFTRLQSEMDAVTTAQSQLAVLGSRREELRRQLRGEAPAAVAVGSPTIPGAAGSGGDTMSRIRETQSRLDELLLRFTDKHPDVVAARATLDQLKERRQAEIEALRRGDPNAALSSGASASPVYQSIQLALNQTDVESATLRRQLTDRQNKVADLRKMLDTMPQVEAEYARLNRDYDVTKAQYTALVERLEKSRLGEEATTSGSVRFDIIDPPFAEFRPASPKRSLLVLGVLVGALAVGAAVAFLMHQLKPVFTSARSLAVATGLPVLGAVSMVWLDYQQTAMRRSYLRYGGAVLVLVVVAAVVLQLNRMGVRFGSHLGA